MNPVVVFAIIACYFGALGFISYLTSRKSNTATFFTANRKSPWYVVAFGMIGASISGVTFISLPGEVGNSNFTYFQMVLGFIVGYMVIINVLLPLYYKLNLISIYSYLEKRFGLFSYKTGASFFMISRLLGSSLRLFLVVTVLQIALFNNIRIPFTDHVGIPFEITLLCIILFIWIITFKAGIKTIVWTDIFQTTFMLTALVISIFIISSKMNIHTSDIWVNITNGGHSKIFEWDWHSDRYFFKQFFSGVFITIVMTGLDQEMMQKNLTCKNLKDSQKNMFWFSLSLIPVNLHFLSLGALLYAYINYAGLSFSTESFHYSQEALKYMNTDKLYPELALNHFGGLAGIVFTLGIIAAALPSADAALTALTTSFVVDILGIDVRENSSSTKRKKLIVHICFSTLTFITILVFKLINDKSIINTVYSVAGYTYGPLLGLYAFGLFSKRKVLDKAVPYIAVISPLLTFLLDYFSETILFGYKFGFTLLIVNGLITFTGIFIFSSKTDEAARS
jgi:Na+/proline symporter